MIKMPDFLTKAEQYIEGVDIGHKFKLKDILGENCPAYPGTWLLDEVDKGRFNTSEYIIKCIGRDSADIYVKESI